MAPVAFVALEFACQQAATELALAGLFGQEYPWLIAPGRGYQNRNPRKIYLLQLFLRRTQDKT
ncbi:MAG: hypothetical protein PHD36_03500 [Desulfotomaculaceae bacterium]|nr:hypothetical protein [Desulfotomaculaceae bacterium]